MMNNALTCVTFALGVCVSSGAYADTVLDTATNATFRQSLTRMAVECDGEPRGKCFLQLLDATKIMQTDFFRGRLDGISGSSPAYQARYKEVDAAWRKSVDGITRDEIFRRAGALK